MLRVKNHKLKLLQPMSPPEQAAESMFGRLLRELKNVFSCPSRRFKRFKMMTMIDNALQLKVVGGHLARSNQRTLQDLESLPPKAVQEVSEGQVLQPVQTLQNHLRSK